MAPGPVDFIQIEAWARLRRVELRDWEISALLRMDRARLDHFHEESGSEDEKSEKPKDVISTRPLSTQLFDALF